MPSPPKLTPARAAELVRAHGSVRAASRASGINLPTVRKWYLRAVGEGIAEPDRIGRHFNQHTERNGASIGKPRDGEPAVFGRIQPRGTDERPVPRSGVARYLLTCAQNNTRLHEAAWENLQALAAHYDAEILVSRFTYDLSSHGAAKVKPGTEKHAEELWYDSRLEPYFADHRIRLAPGLVWCGEMNILPIAVRPLSGFETYTGRESGIFPHVKIAMESVPSGKSEPTKFNYSTGAVTLRNYIQRKAGLKAEFHHAYGALLVEVDAAGDWFVRQVNADSDGTLYDLDVCAQDGRVTTGHRAEGVTWGDIHAVRLDPVVERISWGPGGMIDALRPRFQFMHDLLDFRARNHHERGNPHALFERHVAGEFSVEAELQRTASFLAWARREYCRTVVVDSNHDNALERWLREADYKTDPPNAIFFLEAQLAKYRAIERRDRDFHLLEWALRRHGAEDDRFLRQDESFVICRRAGSGIECGDHGHLGPNGRRGSANAFARMGRKTNRGHDHAAGIVDGVYTAGISAELDQGYNAGPSSWSHSHVVTYPNGKRTVVTLWNGKWRA